MKKTILFLVTILMGITSIAQEITVDLSMGQFYPDEIYFKLSTEADITYTAADWDVAFLRNNDFDLGVRVNDGVGIAVYEVANTPAGYDTVDVTDQSGWVQLYNDPTDWRAGAFQQGSATFGWGEYNPSINTVEGTIVFVLEYADGIYRKFFIESYIFGYTFKYATWDGSAWSADTTETIANSNNPDRIYNYYSLVNGTELVAEPAETDWDIIFTRWLAFINPPGAYNPVTGVMHNPNVTVAQVAETGSPDPNGLEYLEEVNTIGWDWKSFGGTGFVVDSDQKYYVRDVDGNVFRMYFTEFEGQSTGNLQFIYENVTGLLGLESIEGLTFGMYPNPTINKQLTLIYDLVNFNNDNKVEIVDLNGRIVFAKQINDAAGFYNLELDLSSLNSGVYMVRFTSGDQNITKKLVLN